MRMLLASALVVGSVFLLLKPTADAKSAADL
jgi:hypothetical protein